MTNRQLKLTLAFAALLAPAFAVGGTVSLSIASLGAQAAPAPRGADTTKVFPLDRIVAVVGRKAITLFELNEAVGDQQQMRAERQQPPLRGDTLSIMHAILQEMIDAELLKQKAAEFKFTLPDGEIAAAADDRMRTVRADLKTEEAFRQALKQSGIATPEGLRARFIEQERDTRMRRMTLDTLGKLGLMPTISISEKDVEQAFDTLKTTLAARGPTVTFRQLVIKPVPSDTADARAKAITDSLRALIAAGASWDTLARKFSADSGSDTSSAFRGGDLGWMRRGQTVGPFDSTLFSTPIGELSQVFKTEYGYHFLRVDRPRPGEVRARHILITAKTYQSDVERAKAKADSLATALKAGVNYDSLADRVHDVQWHARKVANYPLSDLPGEYVDALRGLKVGDYSTVFEVVPHPNQGGLNKGAVLQVIERNESGEYTLAEVRTNLRGRLQSAGSLRRLLDMLRKQTYVSIRLDRPAAATSSR